MQPALPLTTAAARRHLEYVAHYRTLAAAHPPQDLLADLFFEEGWGRLVELWREREWLFKLIIPEGRGGVG